MLMQSGDTILLVEDEEAAIQLVQQAVAACPDNLCMAVAPDGVAALDWLSIEISRGHPLPRLILLDLKLPKLIGLAVLRTLRLDQRVQHVPIVVFSQNHEPADVLLAYQIGANSFVQKPQTLPEFSRLLQELHGLGWLGEHGSGRSLAQSVPA